MSNYNAKKKPELEALLKERGLPHTGNKPDLVARLQEDDASKAEGGDGGASAGAGAGGAEDNIDWDEEGAASAAAAPAAGGDTNEAAAASASSAAGAAALAAGGQGAVANPVAVPNQTQVEDPAADASLSVQQPGDEGSNEAAEGQEATAAGGEEEEEAAAPQLTAEELAAQKAAEEAKFAAGLAASDADAEAEKRRRRAERFGIARSDEDKKTEERAARFGVAALGDKAVGALDSALPERERKRGRDRADVAGRAGAGNRVEKRVDSRRRNGGGGGGGGGGGRNDRDRAALAKRLERFGGAAAAS